jgi:hypothetical protein
MQPFFGMIRIGNTWLPEIHPLPITTLPIPKIMGPVTLGQLLIMASNLV